MYQLPPFILFFGTYLYFNDPLLATKVLMGATILATIVQKFVEKHIPKSDIITLIALIVFGSITLALSDPVYLQWKLTVTFSIFALITLVNLILKRRPICETLLGDKVAVNEAAWRRCDLGIIYFSTFMSIINTIIILHFSLDVWMYFKLSSIILSMIGSVVMAFYLMQNAASIKVDG
jgi:intracellular septation protein